MNQELQPHKVTKPIQLLAAWLLGLILIDGAFLGGARVLPAPEWAAGLLVIAAVVNVPLFLVCIFLLQTRFRPEMQEDAFYSRYLEVQHETRTLQSSGHQTTELRELLITSQSNLVDSLRVLDESMAEVKSRLAQPKLHSEPGNAQEVLEASETALSRVRQRLEASTTEVRINDLLPEYELILQRLRDAGMPFGNTFGSTSTPATIPAHEVVTIGSLVDGKTIARVCRAVADTGEWYVNVVEDWRPGMIYVGAYGYSGKPVSRLNGDLLQATQDSIFSRELLVSWIERHPLILEAGDPKPALAP